MTDPLEPVPAVRPSAVAHLGLQTQDQRPQCGWWFTPAGLAGESGVSADPGHGAAAVRVDRGSPGLCFRWKRQMPE